MLTIQLALELGQHQGDGLGGTSGGGHNVEGGGTGTAQIAVGSIQQPLVTGVGVGGGHGALDDAELLVQDLYGTHRKLVRSMLGVLQSMHFLTQNDHPTEEDWCCVALTGTLTEESVVQDLGQCKDHTAQSAHHSQDV